jgi:hydrogenase-4 component F
MVLLILLCLPILGTIVAAAVRPYRPVVGFAAVAVAAFEFVTALEITRRCLARSLPAFGAGDFLRADGLSAIVILIVTGVALVSLWFGSSYMRRAMEDGHLTGPLLTRYYVLVHLFVFTMLLALVANNVGVMWVAVEATTITSAFLVGLQGTPSSPSTGRFCPRSRES